MAKKYQFNKASTSRSVSSRSTDPRASVALVSLSSRLEYPSGKKRRSLGEEFEAPRKDADVLIMIGAAKLRVAPAPVPFKEEAA